MSRPNHDNIDYYDCSGKPDGKYIHPSDCTRYIMCMNGRAADMACPDCDPNNSQCAGSEYQRFNPQGGYCDWPSNIECITDP
jgi:hypothetical protein